MSQNKPISERERQRRAKQAAENAAAAADGGAKFAGKDSQRGGFNPSSLVQRHQKKTGRGPKGGE